MCGFVITEGMHSDAPPSIASRGYGQLVARFAWLTVAYNVAVILWGGYVRATGSGAGCGNHWPLCTGSILPRTPEEATMIEFAHRVTSVLALVMVSSLLFWCWRKTSKGDWPRYSAVLAMIFLFNDAFVAAMLVLFGHGWLRGSCSRQFREAFRIEFTGFRYTQDSAPTILTLTGGILFTRRLRRSW